MIKEENKCKIKMERNEKKKKKGNIKAHDFIS